MITRRTAAVILSGASLGVVAAATGPASAHDRGADRADRAERAGKSAAARRARRGMARVIRNCSLSESELTPVADSPRLTRISERLAERVADEAITQEQADARLARAQKRVTIALTRRDARWAPVLKLFGAEDVSALRSAAREAGGMRALIENTDGVTIADFRTARRAGAKAGNAAVRALCADDS